MKPKQLLTVLALATFSIFVVNFNAAATPGNTKGGGAHTAVIKADMTAPDINLVPTDLSPCVLNFIHKETWITSEKSIPPLTLGDAAIMWVHSVKATQEEMKNFDMSPILAGTVAIPQILLEKGKAAMKALEKLREFFPTGGMTAEKIRLALPDCLGCWAGCMAVDCVSMCGGDPICFFGCIRNQNRCIAGCNCPQS